VTYTRRCFMAVNSAALVSIGTSTAVRVGGVAPVLLVVVLVSRRGDMEAQVQVSVELALRQFAGLLVCARRVRGAIDEVD
jgi:hypothetical protein